MEKQPDTIGTPGEHGTERASSATVHDTYTTQADTIRSDAERTLTLPPGEWYYVKLGTGYASLVIENPGLGDIVIAAGGDLPYLLRGGERMGFSRLPQR